MYQVAEANSMTHARCSCTRDRACSIMRMLSRRHRKFFALAWRDRQAASVLRHVVEKHCPDLGRSASGGGRMARVGSWEACAHVHVALRKRS